MELSVLYVYLLNVATLSRGKNYNILNRREESHTHTQKKYAHYEGKMSLVPSCTPFNPKTYGQSQPTDLARCKQIRFIFLSHYDFSVATAKTIKNVLRSFTCHHYIYEGNWKSRVCQPHYLTGKNVLRSKQLKRPIQAYTVLWDRTESQVQIF